MEEALSIDDICINDAVNIENKIYRVYRIYPHLKVLDLINEEEAITVSLDC